MKIFFLSLITLIILSSCSKTSSVKQTFSADGLPAYVVSCYASEIDCLKVAGDTCHGRGYNILNAASNRRQTERDLLFACK